MYASGPRSDWILLIPSLVNSKISRNNCGRWAGSLFLCDTSIMLKTVAMSADFSRIYKKLLTTTWFVHDCDVLLDVN